MAGFTGTQSLLEAGVETLQLFKQVKSVDTMIEGKFAHKDWPFTAIAAESDRFELWSVNLGLFVFGHGSLDYRLRHAESLKTTIGTFLVDLNTTLVQGQSQYRSQVSRLT